MTIQELIDKLDTFDKESEIQFLVELTECSTCEKLIREECDLAGQNRYTDFTISHKANVLTIEANF
jgi:isocitrate/isopropylmalate dehydrogenase